MSKDEKSESGCATAEGTQVTTVPDGGAADPVLSASETCKTVKIAPGAIINRLQALESGAVVGRYIILEAIGRGGMGIVYKAYDPDLDRLVAIKMLHVLRGAAHSARARLLREAKVLASLSHPGVVAAYDVGTFEDGVFVAMELVEGQTLRTWLREKRSAWPDALEVMLSAGRGLAAAHAAGLVHRDFKPENVVIGTDGRVRVLDFGLARALGDDSARAGSGLPECAPSGDSDGFSTPLTLDGTFVGTPGYMPPEQYRGAGTDERGDQFAFCATLYEALYQVKPFGGFTAKECTRHTLAGRIAKAPDKRGVPPQIHAAIVRGLSINRRDRHASMDVLLSILDQRHGHFRWLVIGAGALLAGGLVALMVLFLLAGPGRPDCRLAGAGLAGVWDPGVKEATRLSFIGSGRRHAVATFARVELLLDRYSLAWRAAAVESCEATHLRAERSDEWLDQRMSCLNRRLSELRALTLLFSGKADGGIVDRAVQAVHDLPAVSHCDDPQVLAGAWPGASDPKSRKRLEGLLLELDQVDALLRAGKYDAGVELATSAASRAHSLGVIRLEARSMHRLGWLQARAGNPDQGQANLFKACQLAAECGEHELLAQAALDALYLEQTFNSNHAAVLAAGGLVDALLIRAGDRPLQRAEYLRILGMALCGMKAGPEALAHLELALAIQKRALGDEHPDVGHTLNLMGNVLVDQRRFDSAIQILERALDLWQKALGPEHPKVAIALNNLGSVKQQQGLSGEALTYFRRAFVLHIRQLGPLHPKVGIALVNIGEALASLGRCPEALTPFGESLVALEATFGKEHLYVAHASLGLGSCLTELGQGVRGLPFLTRALETFENKGASAADVARARRALSRALCASGQEPERCSAQ